jgi:hypothetical protein
MKDPADAAWDVIAVMHEHTGASLAAQWRDRHTMVDGVRRVAHLLRFFVRRSAAGRSCSRADLAQEDSRAVASPPHVDGAARMPRMERAMLVAYFRDRMLAGDDPDALMGDIVAAMSMVMAADSRTPLQRAIRCHNLAEALAEGTVH